MRLSKNFEPRFAITRRGYDVDAVESFIVLEQSRANDVQMEQKERISALKAENAALERELNSLRAREEQIKSALVSATEKAEKMTLDVKLRYAMELDRLKLFRAKWIKAYEEMKERYHFSKDALNMESVAVSTELEIRKFLSQDFSLDKGDDADEMEANFKSEADRLTPAKSGAEELKEKLLEAQERKNKAQPQKKAAVAYSQAEPIRGNTESGNYGYETQAYNEKISVSADNDRTLSGALKSVGDKPDSGAAFSLEEALKPKESLADICRYLGLGGTV